MPKSNAVDAEAMCLFFTTLSLLLFLLVTEEDLQILVLASTK